MNNTIVALLVVAVIIVGGALIISSLNNEAQQEGPQGKLFFSVTDAAANMENVSEVMLTVDSVDVYSESEGWINVSSDSRTYNLLELRDSASMKLLAQADVKADSYSKIRWEVGNVEVRTNDGSTMEATLPSDSMEMDVNVNVEENSETNVTLDVLADQSLHTSTEGEYIFAPVVDVEARSNTNVNVSSDDTVTVSGGNVDSMVTIGTDIEGNTKANFKIDNNAELNIGILGGISATGSGSVIIESDTSDSTSNSNMEGSMEGNVDVDTSTGTESNVEGNLELNSTTSGEVNY